MRRVVCFIWKVEANGNDTDVFEVGLLVATDHGTASGEGGRRHVYSCRGGPRYDQLRPATVYVEGATYR